jgi:AcrR family transcriptional regulator
MRQKLRRAAVEIVRERGVLGFSLAEAARRIGVTSGAPYQHYTNARELLMDVAAMGYDTLAARFGEIRAEPGEAGQRLARMGSAYVHFAVEDRARFVILAQSGHEIVASEQQQAATHASTAHLRAVAQEIVGDNRCAGLAVSVLSTAHGFAQLATNPVALAGFGTSPDLLVSESARAIGLIVEHMAHTTGGPWESRRMS